jgi:hypothetical protein
MLVLLGEFRFSRGLVVFNLHSLFTPFQVWLYDGFGYCIRELFRVATSSPLDASWSASQPDWLSSVLVPFPAYGQFKLSPCSNLHIELTLRPARVCSVTIAYFNSVFTDLPHVIQGTCECESKGRLRGADTTLTQGHCSFS